LLPLGLPAIPYLFLPRLPTWLQQQDRRTRA
jgi:hypothetical protein